MSFLDNINLNWYVPDPDTLGISRKPQEQLAATNPFAPKPPTTLTLQGGNVPLAGTSTAAADSNLGLKVEKTTTTVTQPTPEKPETPVKTEEKPFVKTGESVDERLTRYYSSYSGSSRENKEILFQKYITGHFATLKDKTRPEQIQIQLSDYKKLLSNTENPDDYEMMAKEIAILEKENQVLAAKAATKDARTSELRHRAEIGVAKAVPECHKDNQTALTDIVIKSGNEEAQKIGASLVSKVDAENQTDIHKAYFNLDKMDIQKILTTQLGDYDKNAQQSIYKTTMTSKYQDVLVLGAQNIYTLHKDNQIAATKMTVATKNEAAINAAAANSYLCDKSNQAEIKSTLASSGYESVKETLKEAEVKQSAQEASTSTKAGTLSASEQVNEIFSSNSPNKSALIEKIVKNLSNAEKLKLISSISPSELPGVLDAVLANNPSMEVISKAMTLISKLDDKNKTDYMTQFEKSSSFNIIITQTKSMDPSLQVLIVNLVENLDNIKRDTLSPLAKAAYDKRKQEQKSI